MSMEFDLVCLSHLRWDWVYQRPHHLLSRCARERRVLFVEEPKADEGPPRLVTSHPQPNLTVVVPHLPADASDAAAAELQRALLDDLLGRHDIADYVLWYYTPMALGFTRHLTPLATVYDCMDELSGFQNAARALRARETELLARADLVFTGGQSLYEAKRGQHPRVYPFPSRVDAAHFQRARGRVGEPADQAGIPQPRLGYCGVIDERLDLPLLAALAAARPAWQLVLIGPIAKIDPARLPRAANIYYLGAKAYDQLPAYLAGWDVALLPFAHNAATRYISPTKTPEYLAAGRPVMSTSIRDVVRPYGERGLVHIADGPAAFVAAVEAALAGIRPPWSVVDAYLAETSWDETWSRMSALLADVVERRHLAAEHRLEAVWFDERAGQSRSRA